MHSSAVSAGLLLALACGAALAAPTDAVGQLGVGVVVRPSRPAPNALASLSLPPGSRLLNSTPFDRTYHSPTSAAEATQFLRNRMRAQGYRLLADHQDARGARLLWQRGDEHVEFECRQVLGSVPATRIVVTASIREG